ncbi:MAG: ATP-binding protein [Candidatus Obscuribacterales bacterium]|nr:ATP-binding protein [Candidatus Obscuribacterales bacterium]
MRGRQTFFTTASALVQELLCAKRDLKLNQMLKRLDRFDALIIDDISYVPQDREETDVLFVLMAGRYEQRNLIVTSNLPFSQWDRIFKDAVTTMAAVDKLVHHATVLELNGESYRVQSAAKRKKHRALNSDQGMPIDQIVGSVGLHRLRFRFLSKQLKLFTEKAVYFALGLTEVSLFNG